MPRYLAVVWNESDAGPDAAARDVIHRIGLKLPSLERVHARDGLNVFCMTRSDERGRTYSLEADGGVILGNLFGRGRSEGELSRPVDAGQALPATLGSNGGRELRDHYWGRYVAFIREPQGANVLVLPDPTGECPCELATCKGVTLLFSHAGDLAELELMPLTINWRYVGAHLCNPALEASETCINEITQLRAGEALRIDAKGVPQRMLWWDLFEIARDRPIESLSEAAEVARWTIRAVVDGWASCYPRIVHLLSGGLDSSIMLACLMQASPRPQVTSLNLYDLSTGGDERHFARIAANDIRSPEGTKCEQLEYLRKTHEVDLDALRRVTRLARPTTYLSGAAYRLYYAKAARAHGAVLSTGLGGDYIFCRTRSVRPLVDYIASHGLGRPLLRILREQTGSRTYWGMMREGLVHGLLRKPLPAKSPGSAAPFVHPEVITQYAADSQRYWQPAWIQSPILQRRHDTIAPGKRLHIEKMYVPARMNDPFSPVDHGDCSSITWISPLLSQPVLELFSRIPVYVLQAGGIERAVARKAFSGDLPRTLMERRSKGVTNRFIHQVFRTHESYFRELLLDGYLARERLLDRRQLETFLARAHDGYAEGFTRLFGACVDIELLLRSWLAPASSDRRSPPAPSVRTQTQ